jgi:hypothetical protein
MEEEIQAEKERKVIVTGLGASNHLWGFTY